MLTISYGWYTKINLKKAMWLIFRLNHCNIELNSLHDKTDEFDIEWSVLTIIDINNFVSKFGEKSNYFDLLVTQRQI